MLLLDAAAASSPDSFTELVAARSAAYVVLAEVQPMEVLGSWTAAGGGLTNTYWCAFASQVETDVVAGGLYRRLDFVRQNDTNLTSRASAALVNSNLGSYFYDVAASRIYVSTASGLNPDTAALVGAWFTVFLSTDSIPFTDQPLYAPLITGHLPTVSSEMADPLFGALSAATGTVTLLNGNGLFDRLSRRWVWRNKKVTLKLGGVGLDYTDFITIATMRINGIDISDEEASLTLDDIATVLNRSIPFRTWGDGTIVGLVTDEGTLGQHQPVLFGSVRDCPLFLSGTPDTYFTVDVLAHFQGVTVDAVTAINRDTRARTQLSLSDYVPGVSGYSVTIINPTYTSDLYEFVADLTDGTFTPLSETFGQFATQLLRRCGESAGNIDASGMADADIAAPQPIGWLAMTPEPAIDVMRRLEQSVLGQVYRSFDGLWTARVFDPSLPSSFDLEEADFVAWAPDVDLASVLNAVHVQYDFRPASGDTSETSSSDDTVLYGSETSDSHTILTVLSDEVDAVILAQHSRFLTGRPPARIGFEQRGLSLMEAHVGDFVTVTRPRGPSLRTGALHGHQFRLVKIDKSLGPDAPVVRGTITDIYGQTERIARCLDAVVDLNWANATEEQRAQYGFCTDLSGYVDPADPLTLNAKVAW